MQAVVPAHRDGTDRVDRAGVLALGRTEGLPEVSRKGFRHGLDASDAVLERNRGGDDGRRHRPADRGGLHAESDREPASERLPPDWRPRRWPGPRAEALLAA